jgi:prepilin-type N-terminal cleavage/methylation domain-containing protein
VRARGFTLVEALVVVSVVAVLLALLVPTLLRARDMGFRAVCANNLRQQNMAWQSYLQDNKDIFPVANDHSEWAYGGVNHIGPDRVPVLASDRPINEHLATQVNTDVATDFALLFRCPGDTGVSPRGGPMRRGVGPTLFAQRGNSYRANRALFDSTAAGIDALRRPLAMHEVQTDTSRLLLMGDAGWFFATRARGTAEGSLEASWHGRRDAGNLLAVDGSLRFVDFAAQPRPFTLAPRIGLPE